MNFLFSGVKRFFNRPSFVEPKWKTESHSIARMRRVNVQDRLWLWWLKFNIPLDHHIGILEWLNLTNKKIKGILAVTA